MNNTIRPIRDAAKRVVDFIVEHECEGCKRRRKKVKAFLDRAKRDLMRQPRRK
jgi:hypothetical protein